MNDKALAAQQKARQERKRGHYDKAVKRLEQAIAQYPDELELYLDAVDACIEGGEVVQATTFLKTAQEKFTKEKERLSHFVRDKLAAVHDPALARVVVENAVKRRDLESALEHLEQIPDHVARDMVARAKTKKQSLKSASHGGYSLRAEMFTNDLLSALLLFRLGMPKEGAAAVVEILDERPVETKILQPLLAGLEAKQPKAGRIRFAHAVALWANASEVEAIAHFLEAARLDSTALALCAARLEAVREKTKYRPKVERALAEVLLLSGNHDGAAAILRAYLADNKDSGREVLMLLKPHLDPAHGVNGCVWVALDAALSLDQSSTAMEILRPLHQRGNCSVELYGRLEDVSKKGTLASEIMLFHATLALELKDFPRAVEILNMVATTSPADIQSVVALADKHRTAHTGLEELCRKHMQVPATESMAEEGDFQSFDNSEFTFDADAKVDGKEDGIERSSSTGAKKPGKQPERTETKPKKQSFVENRELSLDDEESSPPPAAAEERLDNPGDEISADVFETSSAVHFSSPEPPQPPVSSPPPKVAVERAEKPAPRPAPVETAPVAPTPAHVGITEAHVLNVAKHLKGAGAAAFFHIEAEAAAPPVQPTSDVPPLPRPVEVAEPQAVIAAPYHPDPEPAVAPAQHAQPIPVAAPKPVEPIAVRLERAADAGRIDELHDLLAFEPKNDEERFTQRFYEAEYHALCNRPLPALAILAGLDRTTLSEQQREQVWFKTAVCQRSMNDFAGADETLKRLLAAYPGRTEYARLAKLNYEQFVGAQASDVPILQKTTTLE